MATRKPEMLIEMGTSSGMVTFSTKEIEEIVKEVVKSPVKIYVNTAEARAYAVTKENETFGVDLRSRMLVV